MSQSTARHDPRSKPEEQDVADLPARRPEHKQDGKPLQPAGQPAGDCGMGPDEPDEDEFELVGGDDLGPADLGPAAPNFRDPDAGSGRVRK
jgi:hypothetical protein